MDRQNKVLKELLDRLTSFVTEDKVAELAMLEAQKEVDHKERVLPIKRKSPSFEAQDSSEEVNLGTNDNPIKTKVSGLFVCLIILCSPLFYTSKMLHIHVFQK